MSTVFQISDCHLSDESSFQNLEKALNVANADSDCDTILLTGDICCGPKSGDYTKLLSFVSQHVNSKKQVYAIAGNHDDIVLMKDELKGSLIQVVDNVRLQGAISSSSTQVRNLLMLSTLSALAELTIAVSLT